VNKGIDCDVFQDQLDALKAGSLSDEGMAQLRLHSDSCSECAMSLRVHEHLTASTSADLEMAVPDGFADSIWPGVEAELAVRRSQRPDRRWDLRGRAWLLPVMAAAMLALAVASGLVFTELTRVKARERVLAQTVAEQQRWLAELEERTSANTNVLAAGLASRGWARALTRREEMSIAELGELLRRVPARATVLTTAQAETLMGVVSLWAPPGWKQAISEIEVGDGVRAGELVEILESLDVDREMTLRTSRILGLIRG